MLRLGRLLTILTRFLRTLLVLSGLASADSPGLGV